MPMRKNTQFTEVRKLGRNDRIVELKTTPQARKKSLSLPETIEVRLIKKTIKGKEVSILTSMTDHRRYPPAEIAELYSHRWEIEVGYRTTCAHSIIHVILGFWLESAGTIPKRITHLQEEAIHHVLSIKREERIYPRAIKPKAKKYPNKKASQLN
ncbi:hypothetical protein VVATL9824_00952 [Vibrio vulnificus]|nr:hypothetical protein VVATL9824_00952 [Vibrio vulnificus]